MIRKILVIRFSSIGDIVLTTPVVRALYLLPATEVHFLTKKDFASIWQANKFVKKVFTLSDDFDLMVKLLRAEEYDHIIDLHHNIRTRRIKLALRKPSVSFRKLNFEKWLMVNFKFNRLPAMHIVERYLDTISFLGAKSDGDGLDFFIPPEKELDVLQKFGYAPNTYACIVAGATYNTKCLTIQQIATIAELLKMPIILLGGKSEIAKAEAIIQLTRAKEIVSACGSLDLFQSASVLRQSGTILSHDTGLMHIAAALKKPQVVIWGNTIPGFGMYPYYGTHEIKWISFEINGLKCRPCTKLGFEKCPKGHFKCMLDHDLDAIVLAAKFLSVS